MGSGIDVKTDIVADADIYVDPADGIPVNFPDHIRRKGKKRDPFCGFQPFGGGNRYRGAVIFQTDFVLAEQKIVLQSGEKKEIPLRPRLLSGAKHLLTLAVKAGNGKTVRQIFRNLDVPHALKVTAHPFIQYQGETPGAALDVAFPEDALSLECRITGKNGNAGKVLPVSVRSMTVTLPSERLAPGDYRVEYTLHDRSGTLTETRPLKITTSPWKENEK